MGGKDRQDKYHTFGAAGGGFFAHVRDRGRGIRAAGAHLVVVGDADELAEVGLGLLGDLHEVLAAVGHLHDAHARALVVDEVLLALLEDVERQARGAGGEVVLALRGGGADDDAGARGARGDGRLTGGHPAAGDGARAEGHGDGGSESSHRDDRAKEKVSSVTLGAFRTPFGGGWTTVGEPAEENGLGDSPIPGSFLFCSKRAIGQTVPIERGVRN